LTEWFRPTYARLTIYSEHTCRIETSCGLVITHCELKIIKVDEECSLFIWSFHSRLFFNKDICVFYFVLTLFQLDNLMRTDEISKFSLFFRWVFFLTPKLYGVRALKMKKNLLRNSTMVRQNAKFLFLFLYLEVIKE